jgi:pyruvate/2-oxoglutarate dehydrogenase complex dihydrolipoamide dehydrogenase (E3) component
MSELLTPDICVIGGGSGGLSVAAAAAAFGASVVLVEKGRMGGECLNTGCVPSKALLAAARHARAVAEARAFGIATRAVEVDFAKVREHVAGVVAAIAPNDSKERFTALGVQVIEGAARFRDGATVVAGEGTEIRAGHFVIATGSRPSLPPVPGLEAVPFLTNETVFELSARPEHLLVLGAGPVGLELAQAFRRLGSEVSVLDTAEPLAGEDPECAAVVLDQLVREGVALKLGASIVRVEPVGEGRGARIRVVAREEGGEQSILVSHLLAAAGRRPNVEDLGLEHAGIRYDGGGILVDHMLRTANKRVYAIGDAAGGPQLTHAANYHAGIVVRNALFRLNARVDADAIPRVTFTDPELAHVGLTEAEARRRGMRFQVLRWPYHENDRAQAERATAGHIKVVVGRHGRILGCTIVGMAAGELIAAWTLAVGERLNVGAFGGMIVPYPTLTEIGKRAAMAYFTPVAANVWVRRIMALLRGKRRR